MDTQKQLDFDEKYKDPETIDDIMERIKKAPTLKELHEIMTDVWPGWFIGLLKNYADEYPSLTNNWYELCAKLKTEPKEIAVVEYICFDKPGHNLNRIFGETLTRCGFCVRQKHEIIPCRCGVAIPAEHLYNLLKDKGEEVPDEWESVCHKCKNTDTPSQEDTPGVSNETPPPLEEA